VEFHSPLLHSSSPVSNDPPRLSRGLSHQLTENKVTVKLLGGSLMIEWDREQDQIFMTGPAETVFEGTIEI